MASSHRPTPQKCRVASGGCGLSRRQSAAICNSLNSLSPSELYPTAYAIFFFYSFSFFQHLRLSFVVFTNKEISSSSKSLQSGLACKGDDERVWFSSIGYFCSQFLNDYWMTTLQTAVSNSCWPCWTQFDYTPFCVAYTWPLCANMTSSIKRKYITYHSGARRGPRQTNEPD